VQFAGTDEALYERHLLFDDAVSLGAATARDRFEAVARPLPDFLSQRCLLNKRHLEPPSLPSAPKGVDDGIRAENYVVSAANPKAAQ